MKIDVTAEDIKNGETYRAALCPVALAIKRATDEVPFVGLTSVALSNPPKVIQLHWTVSRKIRDFDKGVKIRPFSFDLEIP